MKTDPPSSSTCIDSPVAQPLPGAPGWHSTGFAARFPGKRDSLWINMVSFRWESGHCLFCGFQLRGRCAPAKLATDNPNASITAYHATRRSPTDGLVTPHAASHLRLFHEFAGFPKRSCRSLPRCARPPEPTLEAPDVRVLRELHV